MTASKQLKKAGVPKKKYRWLWFIGLYLAGIVVVGGFSMSMHYLLGT